jgi:hypothetical protein
MGTAMKRYGRIAWRVIAAVAFAGTATLAVMLTRVPAPGHAAMPSDAGLATCTAARVVARPVGQTGGGGTAYNLELTNVSGRPCDLYGYPDVSVYQAGQAAGTAAAPDISVRPQPVVLAPGDTARSELRVGDVGGLRPGACGQVTARELRVALPPRSRPAFVPVRFAACSRRGPRFMSVQPFQARTGFGAAHYKD